MEEENKVSEEKQVKVPNPNPYKKDHGESDPEVEAFAKGELAKYQREQREKEAIAATEQKDTDASEETAEKSDQEATPIAERPAKAEDRVFKKRYDDLKKHYDSTINKHKEELTSLRAQLESSTKQFVPPKSKEELEAWRKEYPDVYDMVETIAMNKATTQTADLENKYKDLQLQQEQIAKEKAEVELLKIHPDFNDLRQQDDFHTWAEQQDPTIQKHKDELESLRNRLESGNSQFAPPKSKEELEAWRKEYPDVYDMVETIAMEKATTRTAELEDKYKNLQLQQEQIAKEKAEVELLKLHPDFNELRKQDSFHEWAERQDPTIQGWLYENTSNATLAARAIDLYKMDQGISKLSKKQESNVKKEAAKAISKTRKSTETDMPQKKIWTATEISKLKAHEFEKLESEIDLARLEGRIEQR